MTPSPFDITPPQPDLIGGRSLLTNALMQNDMDAAGFRILNLNTDNLFFPSIPTQIAPASNWYNSYNQGSMLFGFSQPNFTDIAGNLTSNQQNTISEVGVVTSGTWRGDQILADKLPPLDMIRAPIHNVNLNSHRVVNMADPIDPQDATTLAFVQHFTGKNPKAAVRCASTANIVALSGLLTIDGVVLVDGDRVLVKDQTSSNGGAPANGIYNAHAGAWTRATDNDSCSEMDQASVFVLQGTANTGNTWLQVNPVPVPCTMGSTPWAWVLISTTSTTATTAGSGLQKIGTVMSAVGTLNRIAIGVGIDIDPAYVGQNSITTLGTISTGTWNGSIIDPHHGGTGINNAFTITLAGNFATSLSTGPAGSSLTFALAGSTALALPLTGTLATLSGNETFTNKHISASQVDTGVFPISQGGTGQITAAAALNALLPIQSGFAGGAILFTNGTVPSWQSLVPVTHGGTGAGAPNAAMSNLLPPQAGNAGKKLTTDGAGNLSWT